MTLTKAKKIIKETRDKRPGLVIIEYYDYYKYELAVLKQAIEKSNGGLNTIIAKDYYKTEPLTIEKLDDYLNGESDLLYGRQPYSEILGKREFSISVHHPVGNNKTVDIVVRDIMKNKNFPYMGMAPLVLTDSYKEYSKFCDEHKEDINKKKQRVLRLLGGLHSVFMPAAYAPEKLIG